MERVQPARVARAQCHPDRAAVAYDQRGQLADGARVGERRHHALELIAQRLTARESELLTGTPPRGISLRLLALDVDEPLPLPLAAICFTQPRIKPRLEPEAVAHDLGGLASPAQIRRPQREDSE